MLIICRKLNGVPILNTWQGKRARVSGQAVDDLFLKINFNESIPFGGAISLQNLTLQIVF